MNSQAIRSLILLAAAALIPATGLAQAAKPYASVNGTAIPKSRADALIAEQAAQGNPETEELRTQVKEELVRREILAQEAKRKGIDKKADVLGQIELARQAVLIRAYLQDYVKGHPVSDAELKKAYDEIVARLGGKEYKARHILVEKESDAKAIIERIKKGEKFDELAKQSKDPGSKDRGGELGWSSPANYVKPFAEALAKLNKAQYTSEPVKTDFGYHVIMLDDVRDAKLPSFEEAKPGLAQRAQQQLIERNILDLRSKAKVE